MSHNEFHVLTFSFNFNLFILENTDEVIKIFIKNYRSIALV